MSRSFVTRMLVESFLCIKHVDVALTPLHAFIGPNDSGKSTLLRAIRDGQATLWTDADGAWLAAPGAGLVQAKYPARTGVSVTSPALLTAVWFRSMLRFQPEALRRPASLIPAGQRLWFQDDRGDGLAALIDALQSRDYESFARINSRLTKMFPTVKKLRLDNVNSSQKALGITLLDDTRVGADFMSEGMLYWLAFAAIEELEPQSILLIEEPENGLHPARIAEVMSVLRSVSKRTQVILATHSPLVVNELNPDEVTIVTRTDELGTICTPMKDTKDFAARSQVYALGELWVSYADGKLEAGLTGS